jgi:hypothetical protein
MPKLNIIFRPRLVDHLEPPEQKIWDKLWAELLTETINLEGNKCCVQSINQHC